MHWQSSTASIETLPNGFHVATIGISPRAVLLDGDYRPIVSDWANGDTNYPDIVTVAPLAARSAANGRYRIYPIPSDPTRYLELARPYVKPAGSWQPLALGNKARTGNRLSWSGPNVDLNVVHGGHFIDWQMPLKGGYVPPSNQLAVPVSLIGLTRQGANILAAGVSVMRLRPPTVYDADNPMDVRPVKWDFGAIGSQTGVLLTLPDLAGMKRPVVDPTWTSQPGAAEGVDTYIASHVPTFNNGVRFYLVVGEEQGAASIYRTLIRFNLSSIPAAAALTDITLSLVPIVDVSANDRIYRVYRSNRLWLEGEHDNVVDIPATGATWNRYDLTNNWANAGAFGATDCEQTDIGSAVFSATESLNVVKSITLVASSKAALDLGNGWLIKADTEIDDAYALASSDHATAAWRPLLEVVYSLAQGGMIGRGRVPALSRIGAMR